MVRSESADGCASGLGRPTIWWSAPPSRSPLVTEHSADPALRLDTTGVEGGAIVYTRPAGGTTVHARVRHPDSARAASLARAACELSSEDIDDIAFDGET
jgi:hypothetical protein